jgi:hypothetical protein
LDMRSSKHSMSLANSIRLRTKHNEENITM